MDAPHHLVKDMTVAFTAAPGLAVSPAPQLTETPASDDSAGRLSARSAGAPSHGFGGGHVVARSSSEGLPNGAGAGAHVHPHAVEGVEHVALNQRIEQLRQQNQALVGEKTWLRKMHAEVSMCAMFALGRPHNLRLGAT